MRNSSISLLVVLVLLMAGPAFAGGVVEDLYPYASVDYFNWSEFKDSGKRILREEGELYGAGATALLNLHAHRLLLKVNGQLFGSVVDYRGQTQIELDPQTNLPTARSERPVNTNVGYVGTKVEADLGWRFPLGKVSVEPFGGLGYRWWLRMLDDSTAVDANGQAFPVSGYTETWYTVYARAGARADFRYNDALSFSAEGGARYPFYVANSVDFAREGTVTFRPNGQLSAIGELTASYKRLRCSLYYEGFEVSSSPIVPVGTQLFLQPHSSSDILGLRVGWSF